MTSPHEPARALSQPEKVHVPGAVSLITSHWSPKLIGSLNNSAIEVKLAKLSGEFIWHSHQETDELFYVLAGAVTIKFCEPSKTSSEEDDDRSQQQQQQFQDVELKLGDMLVVPRGLRHCPVTRPGEEATVLLLESGGITNTGDAGYVEGLTNKVEDVRGKV